MLHFRKELEKRLQRTNIESKKMSFKLQASHIFFTFMLMVRHLFDLYEANKL
jgi:hypothetical protein